MATSSNEIVQSRDLSISGGVMVGIREWRVWETTGAPLSTIDALSNPGLPLPGDEFPDLPLLKLNELITSERIPGNPNMVKVVWDYVSPGGGQLDPNIIEFNVTRTSELIPVYRTPGTPALIFPSQSASFFNFNQIDIAGESNDINGERQTYLRHRMTLSISEKAVKLQDSVRGYAFLQGFTGTRNAFTFFGFPRGLVLYLAPTSRTLGRNEVSVTHHFEADEWFHLKQVGRSDQRSGRVRTDVRAIGGPTNDAVADPVFWRQPFPNFTDFGLISTQF